MLRSRPSTRVSVVIHRQLTVDPMIGNQVPFDAAKQAKPQRARYRVTTDQLNIACAHQLVEQHCLPENKHADRFFS